MIRGSARAAHVRARSACTRATGSPTSAPAPAHACNEATRQRPARAGDRRRDARACSCCSASRSLLLGRVPEVGGFRAWPGIGDAWSTFTGAWRTTFMGAGVAATPAFGLMAAFETALARSRRPGAVARRRRRAPARRVGRVPAGALVRRRRRSPGVGAAVAYAANPIARNAVWQGELGPLVCFALAPFVFARARARDPTTAARAGRGCTRCSHVALLVAVVRLGVAARRSCSRSLFAIAFVVAVPFARDARFAIARARACRRSRPRSRSCCATPWVWSLLGADAATLGFQPRTPLSLAIDACSSTPARAGAGIAPWGILAAAVVPLAIATRPAVRLGDPRVDARRAARSPLAWLPGRISPGASVPAPDGLLVGAALGLAFAAGLGVAAVFDDLRQFHFGWRQVMTVVAGGGTRRSRCSGSRPTRPRVAGASASDDWAATYSWMSDNPPPGGFRVLWVGDPTILPADAKVVGDTGFALDARRHRRRARAVGRARAAGRPRARATRSPPRRRATRRGSVTSSRRPACATSRS